jgi:hypothetical protein
LKSQHTPGPWTLGHKIEGIADLYNTNGVYAESDPSKPICQISGLFMACTLKDQERLAAKSPQAAQGMANARLIAASEDLLAACEEMLVAYTRWNNRVDEGENDLHAAAREMRAAIAKAGGGK